jgi:non-canonical (house-cleaning) NTP pyrophosphatase
MILGADFYVGIEGGLLRVDDRAWEHSWVVIEDRLGQTSTALSAGLEMKVKLLEAILNGQELSDALNEHHDHKDAGQRTGMYGIVTDEVVTRESAIVDAVAFALAPFKNPQYFQ